MSPPFGSVDSRLTRPTPRSRRGRVSGASYLGENRLWGSTAPIALVTWGFGRTAVRRIGANRLIKSRVASVVVSSYARSVGATLFREAALAAPEDAYLTVGMSVLVEDGAITWIRPSGDEPASDLANVEIVDAGGSTMVPGMVDAHSHITMSGGSHWIERGLDPPSSCCVTRSITPVAPPIGRAVVPRCRSTHRTRSLRRPRARAELRDSRPLARCAAQAVHPRGRDVGRAPRVRAGSHDRRGRRRSTPRRREAPARRRGRPRFRW